ncbi:hypothetical protein [Limimaricola cinnabarinus]|uniref:hypothetical protein n=1 Tax=Limimaricola cinnabarinus TaxID=1125964 RepID=UPI00248FFF20|nr:hypothetical protein [Limimaricola cinnabarinus]
MKLDFIITGAPKSGTTLYDEAIRGSGVAKLPREKETNFFSSYAISPKNGWTIRDRDKYIALFGPSTLDNSTLHGEVCPSYFYFSKEVISHCKETGAHLFICLRNPLSRAISHYFMDRDRFGFDLPPPGEVLSGNRNIGYGAWGTNLDSIHDLSDYDRFLRDFASSGLDATLLFYEDGPADNIAKISKKLGAEIKYNEGIVNGQRALRNRSLRFLQRSAIAKSIYARLGRERRGSISNILYKTAPQSSYKVLAKQLYAQHSALQPWANRISAYEEMRLLHGVNSPVVR